MQEQQLLMSGPLVRATLDGRKTQTRRLVRPQPDFYASGALWYPYPGAKDAKHYAGDDHWRRGAAEDWSPYGVPGDRLWVRETWRPTPYHLCGAEGCDCDDVQITYQADGASKICSMAEGWMPPGGWARYDGGETWAPSIHMPRWASRLTLEVTGVRVERLQDISEEGARAEGLPTLGADDIIDTPGVKYMFPRGMWMLDTSSPIPPPGSGPGWSMSAREAFASWWDHLNGDRATWASNPWVWVVSFRRVL